MLFDLPREMWEDHKYILWRRIKCSTLKKRGASFYGCLFFYRSGLSFFFNKMCSSFVANPNLTTVKIYGVWLLVLRVLRTSSVGFIANVDCKFLFIKLVLYVSGTEELSSKQLVYESFPFVICLLVFLQGYDSDGKHSKKVYISVIISILKNLI